MASDRLTVGYMSGPIDGVAVVERWRNGAKLDYFGTSYLTELLDTVERPVILTYHDGGDAMQIVDGIRIYNLKPPVRGGLSYHLESIWQILRSIRILVREKADIAVVTAGDAYWFLLPILRLFGVRIIPALHCRLWSPFVPLKPSHRILRWLNRNLFWRFQRLPTLVASAAIAEQVEGETMLFLPTSRRFTVPPPPTSGPFVILSAGRIEVDQGVFDLVAAGRLLTARGVDVEVHFCGEGTALINLREAAAGLPITVHGFCGRDKMMELLARSHAVVVPTRTDFVEGFAMICAEGVLAGRPVVTSRVCPALDYIRPAAVEVPPNDVTAYADALERLATDADFYAQKVAATAQCQEQFYDPANGYGAKLAEALAAVR